MIFADIVMAMSGDEKAQKRVGLKISGVGCLVCLIIGVFLFAVGWKNVGPENAVAEESPSNWTGATDITKTLGSAKMPTMSGKIGHEEHASKKSCFTSGQTHFTGPLSKPLGAVSNCMAFGGPMTQAQERWYFNMRWDTGGDYPENYKHKKVIITNPKNGKRIVVSIEEYGPADYLRKRDGIVAGAPPDVYNYLELENAYTGNPGDKKGYAIFGFAKDQKIPLGPLN